MFLVYEKVNSYTLTYFNIYQTRCSPETSCEWTVDLAASHHAVIESVYFDLEISDDCE